MYKIIGIMKHTKYRVVIHAPQGTLVEASSVVKKTGIAIVRNLKSRYKIYNYFLHKDSSENHIYYYLCAAHPKVR